ncbi:Ankyrin repeat domain-containing protein 13C [Basidiobolus ranarum]|uniref:Ankyrin repeat domain-containing protein 13C n=1 Tax=Basidiobolus ranarum TaxID=34480 RepID=A0ABR2WNQ4_9FUNG
MQLKYSLHRFVFQNDITGLENALGGSLYNEINGKDHHGNTPLQLSLLLGHTDVAHLLLDRGADCVSRRQDRNGVPAWSPLDDSVALQDRDLVKKIMLKSIEQQTRDWCTPPVNVVPEHLDEPSTNKNPVDSKDSLGGGPLAKLNQRLGETLDMTLHWKFTSRLSNMLARHTLPRDALRIRKKGCYFRIDFGEPTLQLSGGFNQQDERSPEVIQKRRQFLKKNNLNRFSLVIRADDPNIPQAFPLPPTVLLVDHERECIQELYPNPTDFLIDNLVANCMRSPMVKWWLPLQTVSIKQQSESKMSLLKRKNGSPVYKIKDVSISILVRELVENLWTSPNGRTVRVSSNALISKLRSLGFSGLDTLLSDDLGDTIVKSNNEHNQDPLDSDSDLGSDSDDDATSTNSNGKTSGPLFKFLKRSDKQDAASKRQSVAWDEVNLEQLGNMYSSEQELMPVAAADNYEDYFTEGNTGAITFSKAKVSTQMFKFECKQAIKVCWAQPNGNNKSKNLSNGNNGFPITLSQISPVLEHLFGGGILDWAGFSRLCNIAHKDGEVPTGFPVKIDLPIHPVLGVRISTKECEVGSEISKEEFWFNDYQFGVIIK